MIKLQKEIQYSNIFVKQAEVIKELYGKFNLIKLILDITNNTQNDRQGYTFILQKTLADALLVFTANNICFSKEVNVKIDELFKVFTKSA